METMVQVVTGVIVIIIKLHDWGPTKGLHIKCFYIHNDPKEWCDYSHSKIIELKSGNLGISLKVT